MQAKPPIPMWMSILHLSTFLASWVLSLALGLLFGAEVGWTAFLITELRCMSATAVRTKVERYKMHRRVA